MADLAQVLEAVMRASGQRLAAYAYVLTGNASEAEELVQEAVVKTFVRRPRLSDPAAAEQYVRLAMKTTVIDRARKAERFRKHAPSQAVLGEAPEQVTAINHRVAVGAALTSLSAQQRLAIALRYWDDLTVPEVAATMRVRPGTVKRYLHDAAAVLRPLLGDLDESDDNSVRVVGFEGRRS